MLWYRWTRMTALAGLLLGGCLGSEQQIAMAGNPAPAGGGQPAIAGSGGSTATPGSSPAMNGGGQTPDAGTPRTGGGAVADCWSPEALDADPPTTKGCACDTTAMSGCYDGRFACLGGQWEVVDDGPCNGFACEGMIVDSVGQCLQDDAYCNPLPDGTYCTGGAAPECPSGSFPAPDHAGECPKNAHCYQWSESLRCMTPMWTIEACEAVGGHALSDPGDGSLHREGCPDGGVRLGAIDADWDEGGLCCSSGSKACLPQLAYSIGQCEPLSRFAWSGTACVTLVGCYCAGPDCDSSYDTEEACMQAHAACHDGFRYCGGLGGQLCADDEFCAFTPGLACGFTDANATCKPRPADCPTLEPAAPVCGCDGNTYASTCDAGKKGIGVMSDGPCQ